MGWFDFMKEGPSYGLAGPQSRRPPTPGLHLPEGTHIPDWKQYKVEEIPELLQVQKKLAARGLKDPWLRNEVWRYDRKIWGSMRWVRWRLLTKGFSYAIPMFLITIALEQTVFKEKEDHHSKH